MPLSGTALPGSTFPHLPLWAQAALLPMFSLLLLFFSTFNSLLIFGFSISFNYLTISSFFLFFFVLFYFLCMFSLCLSVLQL
jgi:hypothetical protein